MAVDSSARSRLIVALLRPCSLRMNERPDILAGEFVHGPSREVHHQVLAARQILVGRPLFLLRRLQVAQHQLLEAAGWLLVPLPDTNASSFHFASNASASLRSVVPVDLLTLLPRGSVKPTHQTALFGRLYGITQSLPALPCPRPGHFAPSGAAPARIFPRPGAESAQNGRSGFGGARPGPVTCPPGAWRHATGVPFPAGPSIKASSLNMPPGRLPA